MNHIAILVRRELWEHKALIYTPIALGGLTVLTMALAFLFGRIHVPHMDMSIPDLRDLDPLLANKLTLGGMVPFMVVFFGVMSVLAGFYLLDSLYRERKDRSILFWKSMPLSDTETVLAKLVIAFVVCPLLAIAGTVATFLLFDLVLVIAVASWGINPGIAIAQPGAVVQGVVGMGIGATIELLWLAPLVGWLLLASAWAGRWPFLWALLVPAAVVLTEQIVFGTEQVAKFLAWRLGGHHELAYKTDFFDNGFNIDIGELLRGHMESGGEFSIFDLFTLGEFFASPGLYGGLIVAAAFVAGAIWLRRYRPGV